MCAGRRGAPGSGPVLQPMLDRCDDAPPLAAMRRAPRRSWLGDLAARVLVAPRPSRRPRVGNTVDKSTVLREDPDVGLLHTGWNDRLGDDRAAGEHWRHWAHHGVAVLSDGSVVAPAPDGGLLFFGPDERSPRHVATDTDEIHGITAVLDDAVDGPPRERLWLADCGFTMRRRLDGTYAPGTRGGRGPRAVLIELDGREVMSIGPPDCECYETGRFMPTSVAVDESHLADPDRGGTGDVWISDGYGVGVVMRFSPMGTLEAMIDGTGDGTGVAGAAPAGGAGRFDCPHAIFIDRRRDEPELLVADRGNARVQVYGLDGGFRRSFGEDFLTSPSAFATVGDMLVIAELQARIVVLGPDDRLVTELGADAAACGRPGWPNAFDDQGHPIRPPLHAGRFNSPHGLAVDRAGRLLVSEWLIGGRLVSVPSGGPNRHDPAATS